MYTNTPYFGTELRHFGTHFGTETLLILLRFIILPSRKLLIVPKCRTFPVSEYRANQIIF